MADKRSTFRPAGRGFRLPGFFGPLLGLLLVLLVFVVLVRLRRGPAGLHHFLSLGNLQLLVHDNTIVAIAALGMLLIMISGGIDLSVGSVVALASVVTIWTYRLMYAGAEAVPLPYTWHWAGTHSISLASSAAILAGVLAGGLCGLTNGLVITGLRLPPFVATLGMYSMARGLAFWVAAKETLSLPSGARPGWVDALIDSSSPYLFFYPGFWTLVLLAVAVAFVLHFTVLGRHCYAVGSNEATARLCGVPVARTKLVIYTLAGLLTGWAGVLSFGQIGSAEGGSSVGLELIVIAGVVIGGASLNGGQGTVLGTLLGVLILAVLDNGVSSFNVPVEVKWILIGAMIIANTALSQWQRRAAV